VSDLDLFFREGRVLETWSPYAAPLGRPSRWAMIAAILVHLLIALWLLLDWNLNFEKPPEIIPVQLVLETPKPPPPPKPAPPPQPPQNFTPRQSGPEEHTTTVPSAETKAPEPVAPPPPEAPPQPAPPTEAPNPPAGAPAKEPPKRTVARIEPKKEETPKAPQQVPHFIDRAIGEKEETGDPYLNRIFAQLEHNRPATTPIGSLGLHLEGTTVFHVILERAGDVHSLSMTRSSGAEPLDEAARRMLLSALPFPPVPSDYPAPVGLTIVIHLFPK